MIRRAIHLSILNLALLAPGQLFAAVSDPIYQLFEDESDRMVIPQMPLELDSISLGFDASSEKRMESFLNSPAVEETLASLVNRLTPEDLTRPAPAADISAHQRTGKDGIELQFPSGPFFENPSFLIGAAELIARYPLQPVSIEVSAANVGVAKNHAQRISTELADLLMRNPDDFVVQYRADADGSVRIKILGAKP